MLSEKPASGRLLSQGYARVLIPGHHRADYRGLVKEHIVVAEKALGKPIPASVIIHHHNGIRSDNRNTNLVICENHAYHVLIHARLRVFRMGFDPDLFKYCGSCGQCKPFGDFGKQRNQYLGLRPTCRPCTHRFNKETAARCHDKIRAYHRDWERRKRMEKKKCL